MMSMKTLVCIGAVAALAACEDGVEPEISDEMVADMALVAADALLEDVSLMTSSFGFAQGVHGGIPGDGIGTARSGTRSATFFDASGNEQDGYDAETTASIHYFMEFERSANRESWSALISRTRDMTVSGLEGAEATRTFNGTGTDMVSRSRHLDDGDRSYTMDGDFTKSDVVVPVPGSDPRWPLSGTVHRTMTVTRTGTADGDATRTLEMTITFDGDETATAVINGEVIEIDLSARHGENPMHGRPAGR